MRNVASNVDRKDGNGINAAFEGNSSITAKATTAAAKQARAIAKAPHLNLDDAPRMAEGSRSSEILAVDEALDLLAKIDGRKAKVVELRFFGGLRVKESAEVLAISP